MRYASYSLMILGALALFYLQVSDGNTYRFHKEMDPLPMLVAGASLTTGLLLLVLAHPNRRVEE